VQQRGVAAELKTIQLTLLKKKKKVSFHGGQGGLKKDLNSVFIGQKKK
jgi:hypothetical protein